MANTLTFANLTLTDSNIFGGIGHTVDLNAGEEFSIGNTASASVSFRTDTQLPLYSKDATNGKFVWTRDNDAVGRFYITEVTKEGGFYQITAYDAMILLEASVSSLSATFPLTVSAAASAIATYIGCTVSGTVNNGALSVSGLDDMAIRELLGYVAEASGCSVKIDGSDHLCFMYYANSNITIPASQYKTLEVADYTCDAIDNVTIFNSMGDEQATAGSGSNSLYIAGNPFLEGATTAAAQTILGAVSSFVYAPLKCELFDESGLEVGTIATFGTTPTLVMHLESSEEGAMASSVGSDDRGDYNKSLEMMVKEVTVKAETTGQYFWHTSTDTGAGAGAHITEVPKDDFLDDPSNGGGNLLAKSNGIAIRDGLDELATFSASGAQIGLDDRAHTVIDNDGMQIYAVGESFNIEQLANIGYGQGYDTDGNLRYAPFYSIGKRVANSAVGNYSFASGKETEANAYASTALGYKTLASSQQQVAMGYGNKADADSVLVIGDGYYNNDVLVRHNAFTVGKHGLLKVEERKLFAVESWTWDNQQVEAGTFNQFTAPCDRPYWTPLCVKSWNISNASSDGKNSPFINVFRMYFDSNNQFHMYYKNTGTAVARVKVYVQVLYFNTSAGGGFDAV